MGLDKLGFLMGDAKDCSDKSAFLFFRTFATTNAFPFPSCAAIRRNGTDLHIYETFTPYLTPLKRLSV